MIELAATKVAMTLININMRCIEILTGASNKAAKQGLTLT